MGSLRGLLRIGDFRRLWIGQAMSNFGDALTSLALLITAQRLTGSTTAVATTAVAIALPQLVLGMVAGALVDRWDRKRVLIVSDVIRGLLVLGFLAVGSADELWLLYTVAFAQAAVGAFFNPAKSALVPRIVESDRLLAANSVTETSRVIFGVAGTAVAGVVAGLESGMLGMLFVADSATFILSAVLEARMAVDGRSRTGASPTRIWQGVAEGMRAIGRSRTLLGVMVGAGVLMLGLGAVNVLLIPFVIDVLAVPETWFGALEGAQVASMVLAGSLMTMLAVRFRATTIISACLAGAGVLVASLALVAEPWQLLVALFLVGWFVTPLQASVSTLVQSEVDDEYRGRTGAALSTAIASANIASMALAGLAAGVIGVRGVFVVAGIIGVVAGAATVALFRRAGAPSPSPTAAAGAAQIIVSPPDTERV